MIVQRDTVFIKTDKLDEAWEMGREGRRNFPILKIQRIRTLRICDGITSN